MESQREGAASVLDPNLDVRTVVSGLDQPTSMAFLGPNDILVLEKATGKVQRVINGAIHSTALDLAVNFGSERGLLGLTLHPRFKKNRFVYLYWTESTTGADTDVLADTPLLGNRVDRFVWNGSTLRFDQNIIKLRALQPAFAAEPTPAAGRGNHDGGVIAFAPRGATMTTMTSMRTSITTLTGPSSTSRSGMWAGAGGCRTCRAGRQPPAPGNQGTG